MFDQNRRLNHPALAGLKTHQPFLCQIEGRLLFLFCAASTPISYAERRGKIYQYRPDLPPTQISYMPWRVWIWWEGSDPHPLNPDTDPLAVECSPYYADGCIRWIRANDGGRGGYDWLEMPLNSTERRTIAPHHAACGFLRDNTQIYKAKSGAICVAGVEHPAPVEEVLRITFWQSVSGIIVTGRNGGKFQSFLISPHATRRITDAGRDVYKCTILNGRLIHALRGRPGHYQTYLHPDGLARVPSFEDRQIVEGDLQLCPL